MKTYRKMVRIDEDLGKLIRVGRGLDFEDVLDIGTLIYMNHDKEELCIRSLTDGYIDTYNMNWINSSVIDFRKTKIEILTDTLSDNLFRISVVK